MMRAQAHEKKLNQLKKIEEAKKGERVQRPVDIFCVMCCCIVESNKKSDDDGFVA